MKYMNELDAYLENLEAFIDYYDLPNEWFGAPDHVAVKCANAEDYEETIASYETEAERITYVQMDGRKLATVKLASALAVASFGEISWVEIMEPRPEKVGKDVVGFEHMEFTFPEFTTVKEVLSVKSKEYEEQENPGHKWINIVISDSGQELKINNKPLSAIIELELETGQAILL